MGRKSKYTHELLAPVVARATSIADVMRLLGLRPTGGNHRFITSRVRLFALDTAHFGYSKLRARMALVSDDELRSLAQRSGSLAAMLEALDLPPSGRPQFELAKRIRALGIDTSHMHGARWNKGQTATTHPSVARGAKKIALADDVVFSACSLVINDGRGIVKRPLRLGWDYRCQICGIVDWMGTRLVLHLDHINGIPNDNRLENLRLLCPNCHSQTDTYCNKRRLPTRASEPRAKYSCYTKRYASVLER